MSVRRLTPLRHVGAPRVAGAALCLRQDVVEQLVYASLHAPATFKACVLLGEYRAAAAANVLDVSGYAELAAYQTAIDFARDLASDWERFTARLERGHRRHRVVGWASLRPGAGAAFETTDQVAHRTLFNLPWQVLLCLDGANERLGCYGLDDRGYLVNVGFNVVTGWERDTVRSRSTSP